MKKTKFKSYKKNSGILVPFSLKKDFPINVKRIFIINGKKNYLRGDHAHKKCSQFLFPVLGKIKIHCINKNLDQKIILNSKENKGYLVKPKTWLKIKFLENQSILMVFCDREYEFKDYIENYNDFLKLYKIKKI